MINPIGGDRGPPAPSIGRVLDGGTGVVASVEMVVDGYLAAHVLAVMYGETGDLFQMTPGGAVDDDAAIRLYLGGLGAWRGLVFLGVVQWRKPNPIIPLLLGLFTAYGLLMLPGPGAPIRISRWRKALSVVVVALVLFY
jgi:hypothetical protein